MGCLLKGLQLLVISQFPQSIGRLSPHSRIGIEQESFPKIRENPSIPQFPQRRQGALSYGRVLIDQGFPQRRIGTLGFKLTERFNRSTTAADLSGGQHLPKNGNNGWPGTDFPQRLRGSLFDGTVPVGQHSCEADGCLVVHVFPELSQGPGTIFTHVRIGIG